MAVFASGGTPSFGPVPETSDCANAPARDADIAMNTPIPNKTITLDSLREMFANIAAETDWDMSQPMLWGHFFTHSSPEALEAAIPRLMEMGLDPVDIFIADKEDENEPDLFWLQVQEVRIHTPESLDQRNDEFYVFAHREGLDSYDGMDVGPVPQ